MSLKAAKATKNASTIDADIDGRQQGSIPGAARIVPSHFTPGAAAQWLLGFDDAKDERIEAAPMSERPGERLKDIALAAVKSSSGNWDKARELFLADVRHDAALLWELFQPFQTQAAQRYLSEASLSLRQTSGAGGSQRGSGRDQRNAENQREHAPSARPRSIEAITAANEVAKLSLLDTFKINGRSIGDVDAYEALGWAKSHERDTRFVRLLTDGLPVGIPIRRFRTPEEAQQLYALAQDAANA